MQKKASTTVIALKFLTFLICAIIGAASMGYFSTRFFMDSQNRRAEAAAAKGKLQDALAASSFSKPERDALIEAIAETRKIALENKHSIWVLEQLNMVLLICFTIIAIWLSWQRSRKKI